MMLWGEIYIIMLNYHWIPSTDTFQMGFSTGMTLNDLLASITPSLIRPLLLREKPFICQCFLLPSLRTGRQLHCGTTCHTAQKRPPRLRRHLSARLSVLYVEDIFWTQRRRQQMPKATCCRSEEPAAGEMPYFSTALSTEHGWSYANAYL